MTRRPFLFASLFSTVGALLGKPPVIPTPMPSSVEGIFNSCSLKGFEHLPRRQCNELVLNYDGNGNDGFRTFLEVDGRILPSMVEAYRERAIVVVCELDQPLSVVVLTSENEILIFQPENFDFTLNWVEVKTRKNSPLCPWWVTLQGIALPMTKFSIIFSVGMAVHTNMSFIAKPNKLS